MRAKQMYVSFLVVGVLAWTAWESPPIAAFLVAALLFYRLFRRQPPPPPVDPALEHVTRQASRTFSQRLQELTLAEYHRRNPSFDEHAFLDRIKKAFRAIQSDWPKGTLGARAVFFADGVSERFALHQRELQASGRELRINRIDLYDCQILDVRLNDTWEKIHVQFKGTMLTTTTMCNGDRQQEEASQPFHQIWTCIRRAGVGFQPGSPDSRPAPASAQPPTAAAAGTSAERGLAEGYCPACRAEVRSPREIHCHACGEIFRSGTHDWILTEIIPGHAWAEVRRQPIPGLDTLESRDPGFQILHLRDLTAAIFYRWRWAMRTLDIDALAPFMPGHLETLPGFADNPAGGNPGLERPELCETRILAFREAPDQDRFLIRMAWTGRPTSGEASEFSVDPGESRHRRWGICVLARPHGALSTPEAIFNSCSWAILQGLIQQDARTTTGQTVPAANPQRGWLIEAIASQHDPDTETILASWGQTLFDPTDPDVPEDRETPDTGTQVFDQESRRRLLPWIVGIALLDGEANLDQIAVLQDFGKTCGVSPEEMARALEDVRHKGFHPDQLDTPGDIDTGAILLEAMATTALTGRRTLSDAAKDLLIDIGARAGFRRQHVERIIQREQERLQ